MKKELRIIQTLLIAILVVLMIGFGDRIISFLTVITTTLFAVPHDIYKLLVAISLFVFLLWVCFLAICIIWDISYFTREKPIGASLNWKIVMTIIFLLWVGAVPLLVSFDLIK